MPGSEFWLELDRRRPLKFGFKALRLVRERLGDKELTDLQNMSPVEMPVVVWAGLSADDPTLTVEKTEELLDSAIPECYTVTGIIKILGDAILAHLVGKATLDGGQKKGGGGNKALENILTKPEPPPSA